MKDVLLMPPIALAVLLMAAGLLYYAMGILRFRRPNPPGGLTKPYACGEEQSTQPMLPDYGMFFPFAFFFTILHVVALTVTTVPVESMGSFLIAVLYISVAVVGLLVLYRR